MTKNTAEFSGKSSAFQARAHAAMAGLVIAAGLVVATAAASAQGYVREIKLGLLGHDVPYLWSGFNVERGIDVSAEVIFTPSLPLFGGNIRPGIGASINSSGYTDRLYATTHWEFEFPKSGLFASVGLGAAIHDGHLNLDSPDHKALGARILFHIPAEIGYRLDAHNSLSIYFEHMSNGYTVSPNEGQDNLGVRYGYRY